MKKYKIASILMFIHGAFMEIGGCLKQILYLIFDYPHKHYTFKYFEV